MSTARRISALSLTCLLALATTTCIGDKNKNAGNAADLQGQLQQAFATDNIPGFADALDRLIETANGSPQQGVTLVPITGGVQGSVGVDVDGNGQLETTVNGTLHFNNAQQGFASGGTLTITSIDGGAPQTASGSATVTPLGPATVDIEGGQFSTHTDTRGNNLNVTNASLTVDGSSGLVITGTLDFTFNGLAGQMFFDPDGHGGFTITVSGNGFQSFTVP